ncbi:hypothetical protein VNO78_20051 [Psophocarpus tetragonolobus]|uniref:Uncharacterized protein n=1 Tax=Psophocarpus tetragonolobus TaxID=3891 RepID=A0AAN9SA75_PSOTE
MALCGGRKAIYHMPWPHAGKLKHSKEMGVMMCYYYRHFMHLLLQFSMVHVYPVRCKVFNIVLPEDDYWRASKFSSCKNVGSPLSLSSSKSNSPLSLLPRNNGAFSLSFSTWFVVCHWKIDKEYCSKG